MGWFLLAFFSGDSQIGLNVTPLDPSTVASEVWYGKESGKYSMKKTGVSMVYSQLYPFEGLQNYTSGIIHHVKIDGKQATQLFFIATYVMLNLLHSDIHAVSIGLFMKIGMLLLGSDEDKKSVANFFFLSSIG